LPFIGLTYSNDDESCSSTNYNPRFKNYASSCADCQNFVSQCVWYGFGGYDTAGAINGHMLPMIDTVDGAADWWGDSSGASSNNTWISVTAFTQMIKDNYANDRVGVQGRDGVLSSTLRGDIVSMKAYNHVFIVNDVYDDGDGVTQYDEVYVCAHTNNLRDHLLSDRVPDPSAVKYLDIVVFKEPS